MSEDRRLAVVRYWLQKADEALESALSEQAAGRLAFASNRAFYGCFYSASAVLLASGERFLKHSGVRAAVHRVLVKAGRLQVELGRHYDLAFLNRQRGDYQELVEFQPEEVDELIAQSKLFVRAMRALLSEASISD